MNVNRVISFPNGTTALTAGQRVALAVQNGYGVTVPAGTAVGSPNGAIGVVMRDIAAGTPGNPAPGTDANGLATYSTSDVFCPGALMYGQTDGVITAGQAVYAQAGGLITATNTGQTPIGIAVESSIEAGDLIRFVSLPLI